MPLNGTPHYAPNGASQNGRTPSIPSRQTQSTGTKSDLFYTLGESEKDTSPQTTMAGEYVLSDNGQGEVKYTVKNGKTEIDASFAMGPDEATSIAKHSIDITKPGKIQDTYVQTTTFIDAMFEARPDIEEATKSDPALLSGIIWAVGDESMRQNLGVQDDSKGEKLIEEAVNTTGGDIPQAAVEKIGGYNCTHRAGIAGALSEHYGLDGFQIIGSATEGHAYNTFKGTRTEAFKPETQGVGTKYPDILEGVRALVQETQLIVE